MVSCWEMLHGTFAQTTLVLCYSLKKNIKVNAASTSAGSFEKQTFQLSSGFSIECKANLYEVCMLLLEWKTILSSAKFFTRT